MIGDQIVTHIIHGLILGLIISFVAIGYSLIYSILNLINFAHGEVMMLAAYSCYIFYNLMGIKPFFLSATLAILFTSMAGIIIEKIAYKPLRERDRLAMILSSLCVSIILQSFVSLIFQSSRLNYNVDDPTLKLFSYPFYIREIIIILIFFISFAIINYLLNSTRYGLALRSIASNLVKTNLLGIHVDNIISGTFFIASFLAGIAGISLGIQNGLEPSMGFQYTIWSFMVAVISGLGSIRKILFSGILFGIIINFAMLKISSYFVTATLLTIMGILLIFRPKGFANIQKRNF